MKGTCRFQAPAVRAEGLRLQLDMVLRLAKPGHATQRRALFCYPPVSEPHAPLAFEFPPLVGEEDIPLVTPQTAAVFLSICTPPDPRQGQEAQPLSNVLGVLATFR